jgi:hypothetical protein
MAIYEHAANFAGLPVSDYDGESRITDPATRAQCLRVGYDAHEEGMTFGTLLEMFLSDPGAREVTALVVGDWGAAYDSENSAAPVVAALAAARDRLPALKALFLGDITSEETEISWIRQTNITPLLEAYPDLEELRVRGGEDLELDPVRHERLRSLILESGGLPGRVVRAVGAADLPNLEHLELWLGSDNYGGDATVADLAPILEGKVFPRLKYLGLRDCERADEVAAALAGAPIVRRIEVLDLSLGNLADEGAVALLNGGQLSGLRRLDIHHHYVSDEVLDGLTALGIELNTEDRQEPDEYGGEIHRYIAVSE